MAAAPAESCQFAVPRSPGGRIGSVKYMCNRLRRMRGRFQLEIHLPRCISSQMSIAQNAKVLDPELSGEPPRIGAYGVGDYQTPDLSQNESGSRSASEKSKQFGPDGAPFPCECRRQCLPGGARVSSRASTVKYLVSAND